MSVCCAVAVCCGCCGSVVVVGTRGGAGVVVGSSLLPRVVLGKLLLSPLPRAQLQASMSKRSLPQPPQLLQWWLGRALKKLTQLLRHRLVVGQTDLVEEVEGGYIEEGQVQNVDEEVAEEDREDDPDQVMLMTTAKTMKLAKKMSMSKGVARGNRREDADTVVKDDVEEVVREMVVVMCRCGCGGSLLVRRAASRVTLALLPC